MNIRSFPIQLFGELVEFLLCDFGKPPPQDFIIDGVFVPVLMKERSFIIGRVQPINPFLYVLDGISDDLSGGRRYLFEGFGIFVFLQLFDHYLSVPPIHLF